ncbi:hypothetical protein L1987_38036 [Smallanthus sonchifolius]|uniref:Uncharacterized protein n=1 Tax=Smallanthus sonchifolius TaxID=185202 RepID=A0ACB9HHJ9_9ASTR|nr:hypothetical protein L1987_38036 [Smallanthus sonchifolius]
MVEVDINHPDDTFSPYHNLTAYLIKGKKSKGFNDMIDFLCRSKIHHALTVNPTIYIPHMEDFWNSAVYSTEQGIPQIQAKVDGKDITITEATLRKHLKLQDEGAAISYSKEEYMRTFGFNFAHLIFEGLRYNFQEGAKQSFFMYPRFLHEVFNNELKDLSKSIKIYLMLGHKNNIQSMRTVSKKFSGVNVPLLSTMMNIQITQGDSSAIPADTDPTPSSSHPEQQSASTVRTHVHTTKDAQAQKLLTPVLDVIIQLEQRAPVAAKDTRKRSMKTPSLLVSKAQSQPKRPHSESQNSDENIKRDNHIIRETSLEASLLGSGSHPGSIEQPTEPFHYFSSLNLSVEAPCQDDIPSQTTTLSKVLIDLAASAPNPSSSPKKVHSGSTDRVNVERAVTTPGTSTNQEDSDNITKTLTTATHSEDVSFETLFTERNPRCQENQGDEDVEARPKIPSSSKDSTTVDEDMGTQTNETLYTDATKKGEIVVVEDDADSLEDWIQEQAAFKSSLFKLVFVQVHDLPNSVDEEEEITKDCKLVV